ncbi:MAG: methyltransferase domain-containing protein [Chthoniobacterales bacterium]
MKLSHKIKKFANIEGIVSLKRALWRKMHPLPVSRFMKEIDPAELQRLKDVYGIPGEKTRWPKYVNAEPYLELNIRQAQDLELDQKPPMRILDIGSGAGYFLFVARILGHSGMGMDLEEPKLYEETFRLFGLERTINRIDKFVPLPDTGKYDLITAFAIVFNNHSKDDCWGIEEWKYFLDDATQYLNPGGRIFLNLNPHPTKGAYYYSEELKNYLLSRGAVIDHGCNVFFPPKS